LSTKQVNDDYEFMIMINSWPPPSRRPYISPLINPLSNINSRQRAIAQLIRNSRR